MAEKITAGEESIPLNQPFPEEIEYIEPHEDSPKAPPLQAKEKEKTDSPDKKSESDESLVAGYTPLDILQAPLKPPEPVKTEGAKATSNSNVLFLMGIGILLCLVGLIMLLIVNVFVGVVIIILGGLAIVFSVFAPLR